MASIISKIIILPTKMFGTFYESEYQYQVQHDQIEEYEVLYDNILIAKFWISNNSNNLIMLYTPLDITILQYIMSEMNVRDFPP